MLGESAIVLIRWEPKLLVDTDSNSFEPKMLEPYQFPVAIPDLLEVTESCLAAKCGFETLAPLGCDDNRITLCIPDRIRSKDELLACPLLPVLLVRTVSEALTLTCGSGLPFCS